MEQSEKDGGLGSGEIKKSVDNGVGEKDSRSNMKKYRGDEQSEKEEMKNKSTISNQYK